MPIENIQVSFAVEIGGLNEEQTIEAPADAQPISELFGDLGSTRARSAGSAAPLPGGGGSGGGDAFQQCMQQATTRRGDQRLRRRAPGLASDANRIRTGPGGDAGARLHERLVHQ